LGVNKYVIDKDDYELIQVRLAYSVHETGAPQGEELGLMKPISESSCSCSDNSFISDGANRYGARATGAASGIRSIWNSTGRAGGRPSNSSGNTFRKYFQEILDDWYVLNLFSFRFFLLLPGGYLCDKGLASFGHVLLSF
nr:hypothetical protein [Tanacetum cinerariifolium]